MTAASTFIRFITVANRSPETATFWPEGDVVNVEAASHRHFGIACDGNRTRRRSQAERCSVVMSIRTALALLGCCGWLVGCRDAAFGPEDEAAVRAVLEAQQTAWNAQDIDGFMAGYHNRPDVVFASGGNVRRGWDKTMDAFRTRYVEGDAKMGTLEFSDLQVRGLSADAAVAVGFWRLTDTPQAGHGAFSLVLTEIDGRWGVQYDHTSAADGEPKEAVPPEEAPVGVE
jgi:uncharacterized protein (TIGR02246 family)